MLWGGEMGNKKRKFNNEKYISHRRKQLKEEMSLIMQRDKLTKQIRELRSEMSSWDRHLVMEGDK